MIWKPLGALIFCALTTGLVQGKTPLAGDAQHCEIHSARPARQVFAKVDDRQPWTQYKRVEGIPELSLGFGTSAETWTGPDGALLVRTEDPGEDFNAYTDYCFNKTGELVHIDYQLRTAWDWGFRMAGLVMDGTLHTNRRAFFSTESEKPIPRPKGADDIPDALNPVLYRTLSKLPFAHLLK
jgi:hypothetical protein